jgi:hypothetical protein
MRRVMIFDDLDNEQPAEESVPFAVDDTAYVVDLSSEHAAAFRELLAPYIAVATKLGKQKIGGAATRLVTATAQQAKTARSPKPDTRPATTTTNGSVVPAPAFSAAHDSDYLKRARTYLRTKHPKLPPRLSNAHLAEYDEHLAATGATP